MSLLTDQQSPPAVKVEDSELFNHISVDFVSKLKHDSRLSNITKRSDLFYVTGQPQAYDIWKLQPPNFNPQVFEPSPLKQREALLVQLKTECADIYRLAKSAPTAKHRRKNEKRIQDIFANLRRMEAEKRNVKTSSDKLDKPFFHLRFRPTDTMQSKIAFTRDGIYKNESYVSPQLHDYRQYPTLKSLGLPEFITNYDRDCFGLKCKTEGLSIMQGRQVNFLREVPVRSRAEYAVPRFTKWDSNSVLPKLPYPNKYAAYSRHRRKDRSARSAFLERAEDMMIKRSREIKDFKKKHRLLNPQHQEILT